VEDKANGTAVIAMLSRTVPGVVPEEPHGGKVARAAAISPLVEAGNVWLPAPDLAPWVGDYITQHAAFPTGTNDDEVDQTSQALNRMVLQPLLAGRIVTAEDLDDDLAGFSISPY
jgi:predicted phage terminase large subunit-like protein